MHLSTLTLYLSNISVHIMDYLYCRPGEHPGGSGITREQHLKVCRQEQELPVPLSDQTLGR